ncbi:RIP metalloprotease RseP [bacterium]|nr:MAG: RIP metalloprotease RseP [bacterium]
MDSILEIIKTIGIFVPALLILVFVHEFGHFITAKLFKMRVERFSLGFPPRLFGFQWGETDYCVSATPLGGYVKISGMIDESMDVEHLNEEPQPWEFRSKPVWQRIIVISGGVIFNVILAAVIYSGLNMYYGEVRIPMNQINGFYVAENTLAQEIGFQTGDKIETVNGKTIVYFQDLLNPATITSSDLVFGINRNGEHIDIKAPANFLDLLNKKPFFGIDDLVPSKIYAVAPGSPADQAGLKDGDVVVGVDGNPIQYWAQLYNAIKVSEGDLSLQVVRNATDTLLLTVMPNMETKTIGIQQNYESYFKIEFVNPGFFASIGSGVNRAGNILTGIVNGFAKLVSGDISVKENLGGPVAIAKFTKDATDAGGFRGFWEITAMLSLTLAVMNILPIPVLDGGHLVFLIYEGITRREPSAKIRMIMQQVGFVLIIGLIIFVTFNDIMRQIGN